MWIDQLVSKSAEKQLVTEIWQPDHSLIVLGSSNKADIEVYVERCQKDGIDILKRKGGGGAVLLHPGCLILSLGMWVKKPYQNKHYFSLIHAALISLLKERWPKLQSIKEEGISDLAFENKKIAGTSMFRSRNFLLYQGSLLVESYIVDIERYLKHPSREPDYRQKRLHRDFLSSLNEICGVQTTELKDYLSSHLAKRLLVYLKEELIDPPLEQVSYIKEKLT